jgi:hypothetical protein
MVYFKTKNANLGKFLECFAMRDVGQFFGHFVYFSAVWYILWPFGIFGGHFGIFFPFRCFGTKKNLATLKMIRRIQPCIMTSSSTAPNVTSLRPINFLFKSTISNSTWHSGDIASASVTEDQGSNPAGYKIFRENISTLLSIKLKWSIKALAKI